MKSSRRDHRSTGIGSALAALCMSCCMSCNTSKGRALPASGATGKLEGRYSARATNPGGRGDYSGDVAIRRTGSHYSLDWHIGKDRSYRGVGIEVGNFLGVGWGVGSSHAVFVYELAGGKLAGRWASSLTNGKLGSETLEGSASLNGTYRIVDGYDPARDQSYDGTVSIAPNGVIYRLQRAPSSGEPMGAVGIKKGNLLVVGAGPRGGAGVMVYTLRGEALSGQWAQPTSNLLGTEYLTRR